jgi:sugar lactone lactonase YvrE
VAFDAKGHLLVLTRGDQAFFEFEPNGQLVRSFGGKIFTRAHGLRIDKDGFIWATDVGAHTVMKLGPDGTVVMTLGVKGEAGAWDEAAGSRKLNQPNDVAIAPNGDIFVVQGHTPGPMGDPRVLKFDKNGTLLTQWGGRGTGPGQFVVAHGAAIDSDGHLWVLDRENQRIQVFETSGKYLREMKFAGLPCSIVLGATEHYMVNGFAGQLLRLDRDGKVLNAIGKPGNGPGEYGEAHFIAMGPAQEIIVADSVSGLLTKYVKKK